MEDEKELSFPFDSIEDESGIPDRLYYSKDFAQYFKQFIGNGVYPNPSNCLKVDATTGMVLKVRKGSGYINGYGYVLPEDLDITINTANASYTRKDIIVLRLDLINRLIRIYVKEGTPSSSPQIPTITRDADTYELKLAEITIKASTQTITQAEILDTRLDKSVCGVVSAVVQSVDTQELFNQYETYLNQKISEWNNTKQQQQTDWQEQMQNQQQNWESQTNSQQSKWQEQTNTQQNQWQEQFNNQQQDWQEQTDTQQRDWQEQFDNQQSKWQVKMTEIQSWYDDVKNDISKLQNFDFDNLALLSGAIKTVQISSSIVDEIIKSKLSEKNIAKRTTTIISEKEIKVNLIVYNEDGVSELYNKIILTKINEDNSVTEEVD